VTKPEGVGLWAWYLDSCEGGDLDKIIERCKTHKINWLAIKAFDGSRVFASNQFADSVNPLKDAGINVYGWGYCYGRDPLGEADGAIHTLELGADGYIFDAEQEFEESLDPEGAADRVLGSTRASFPDSFLAYSPFAIPSYHRRFPYRIFEQYTDAVMPMVYWKEMGQTPEEALTWHKTDWIEEFGHLSWSRHMPIGQAYDGVTPLELAQFDLHSKVPLSFWAWQDGDEYDMDSMWTWRDPVVEDPKMKDLRIGADATRALNEVVARLKSTQSELKRLVEEGDCTLESIQQAINVANNQFKGRG
jgi:hypothetical protein